MVWFGLVLWHINHWRLFIPKSILNIWTILFQTIQFSIITQSNFIWPIDKTLSGATTPSQSRPVSDGNEGVLRIPESSCITGTSPSYCLVSYQGHSWVGRLTPVQRWRRCILQLPPTGPALLCLEFRFVWNPVHSRLIYSFIVTAWKTVWGYFMLRC